MSKADSRRETAEAWAAEQLGWRDFASQTVASDASARRYFRLSHADQTRLVMDAPPERENTRNFVDIAKRLAVCGINVPQIHAHDPDQGLILLGDLGHQPFHHILNQDNADALFHDAVQTLIRIQLKADTDGLPDYDPALLLAELALFPDWFLARHWRVEPSEDELDSWDMVCANLLRWALDQAQVFCHRDYMPRNLLLNDPNPGIIDFQDAVRGPISYDPVCLFRDAFLSWPPQHVDAWLEDYRQRALKAGLAVPEDPDLWRRSCDFIGVQRHLKVIGIFARIRYRDGKPRYLEDSPRFFHYLEHAMGRNHELVELQQLLTAWRSRRRMTH